MITGNKGEWSEIYVLLRLLGDGRIYAADEDLQKIEEMYFPILKIIRQEMKSSKLEYRINDQTQIFVNDEFRKEVSSENLSVQADHLYGSIVEGESSAFGIEGTERFMKTIFCFRLAAPSTDKTDITLQLHDIQTGYSPICGFSIKSELGNPSTLINASKATNFTYELTGITDEQMAEINSIKTREKIKDRMRRIFEISNDVSFLRVDNSILARNLMLIDSRLPELLSIALLYHYRDNIKTCKAVVESMARDNPMNYPDGIFYGYKFRKFLCSAALGMTPASPWDGVDEANGGYIVVNKTGEVLAFHIYNRDFFEKYLLNQTRFERGSTSRHNYASLYKDNGKMLISLNMQIRFV